MQKEAGFYWDVGDLPFIFKPLREPVNENRLPNALPFRLTTDKKTGTLQQSPNGSVLKVLTEVYEQGSMITGMMEDDGIGKAYAEDFLAFIQSTLERSTLPNLRVLEIGCGTGYLLSRLKSLGAEVIGIEPGSHGQKGAEKYKVRIVRDFFPSSTISGRFDCIIMYDSLEHMQDPVNLLRQVKSFLTDQGKVLIAVEDEEPYLTHGDVSILFHQHFSYFTEKTLSRTFEQGGFDSTEIRRPNFSRLLYVSGTHGTGPRRPETKEAGSPEKAAMKYKEKALKMLAQLSSYLAEAAGNHESVGIFVPHRAVNALALMQRDLLPIRFFDDNPQLNGTYFPGIPNPIESRQSLIHKPTDRILILSNSFGEKIASELHAALPARTVIQTWNDIFKDRKDGQDCLKQG